MTQSITLDLVKGNEAPKKLSLDLVKDESFKVRLSWDGNSDLDLHVLACHNNGTSSTISAHADILSTYNVERVRGGQTVGTIKKSADGTFQTLNGALVHSADAIEGDTISGDDEWVKINPALLPADKNEIPIIVMIHPQTPNKTFAGVKNARVVIEDSSGNAVMDVSLSDQFGAFNGVQMGSILIDSSIEFAAVGVGFNGDFNSVIAHFC